MIHGIHHITAISSEAQEAVHFYTHILGLRLVKKTVNQDDVGTYHLFFGDTEGNPGMDLTFFIFLPSSQGQHGTGLVTTISLEIPESAVIFWKKRFEELGVRHSDIETRFGRKRIKLFDKDNQQLEMVGVPEHELDPTRQPWTAQIPLDKAITNFHSATLSVVSHSAMSPILTDVFGYTKVDQEAHITLYELPQSKRAYRLEVSEEPSSPYGYNAAGTVHHIAFRAKDEAEQQELRNKVVKMGLYPTEVINRFYFKSVYFRTPGGILFEIATDQPGFTADEDINHLGEKLSLPPFMEYERQLIESQLQPL